MSIFWNARKALDSIYTGLSANFACIAKGVKEQNKTEWS